jgi:hypothetical protein
MTVLHSTEDYAMYPHVVISPPFDNYKTSNVAMLAKHNHTSFCVRPGDQYIPFTKVPLVSLAFC